MVWVDLVTLLALVQFFLFAASVAMARARFGVHAPATTGHPLFERYFRVHQNTLELLVMFIPSMWLAVRYWYPTYVAAVGVLFLIGRTWYYFAYVKDPKSRTGASALSFGAIGIFWIITAIGIARSLIAG
jgi:glutathione S-transferase